LPRISTREGDSREIFQNIWYLALDIAYDRWYSIHMMKKQREIVMKIKEGDLITEGGISYVVEKDEDGTLWGVSNNAEYEIELSEDFVPDAIFPS